MKGLAAWRELRPRSLRNGFRAPICEHIGKQTSGLAVEVDFWRQEQVPKTGISREAPTLKSCACTDGGSK